MSMGQSPILQALNAGLPYEPAPAASASSAPAAAPSSSVGPTVANNVTKALQGFGFPLSRHIKNLINTLRAF